ncbi:MAG: metal-dependent transcriptional regulator [Promethearchaeota archaeon]
MEQPEETDVPESYQKYLDGIYLISRKNKGGWVSNKEIANYLKVEPASVSGMLEKLKKQGFINWEPRKSIRLTKKGKQVARQLSEVHKLLSIFFKKVLKVQDEKLIEKLSCDIEHHITADVAISLRDFLDNYLQ